MRILFLSNFFPPHELGGYAQLCSEVATALQGRGHNVHVLTSTHRSDRKIEELASVTRTLYLQSDINYYRLVHFFRRFHAEERHNLFALTSLIEEFQPDLVFVWGMWNLSLQLPRMAETLMPGRVAYYLCSYWPDDEDIHLAYWNQPTRRPAMAFAKGLLKQLAQRYFRQTNYPPVLAFENAACVSQYVRDRLVQAEKLPSSANVLYNGGDFSAFYQKIPEINDSVEVAFEKKQQPLRLLYVGRLIADKGVHTALAALVELRKEGWAEEVTLTVLGDGRDDYISSLKQFIDEAEIEHLVEFHGGVPRDEVPSWLHKHDLFLFTSTWAEPLARSVMEAMMAGLLIVGSEVGGQREMLRNGENALTFQAGDATGLATQIKSALQHPIERVAMARAGQKMVIERFNQKRMIDDMDTWLESLLTP